MSDEQIVYDPWTMADPGGEETRDTTEEEILDIIITELIVTTSQGGPSFFLVGQREDASKEFDMRATKGRFRLRLERIGEGAANEPKGRDEA